MTLTLGSIVIPQGCDSKCTFTITDVDGVNVDVNDYTARFRVSNKELTKRYIEIVGDSTPDVGIATVNDPDIGIVTVTIKPHSSIKLPSNNEVGEESILQANNIYSLVLINNSNNEIIKVAQGDCYVEVEI